MLGSDKNNWTSKDFATSWTHYAFATWQTRSNFVTSLETGYDLSIVRYLTLNHFCLLQRTFLLPTTLSVPAITPSNGRPVSNVRYKTHRLPKSVQLPFLLYFILPFSYSSSSYQILKPSTSSYTSFSLPFFILCLL